MSNQNPGIPDSESGNIFDIPGIRDSESENKFGLN